MDAGTGCETCPEGYDPDNDCIGICGDEILAKDEHCEDGNEIEWDGCNNCQVSDIDLGVEGSRPSVDIGEDGTFVVVFQKDATDGDGIGVFGQMYDTTAQPIDEKFQVNTYTAGSQSRPRVAYVSGHGYVVIWQSDGQDGDNYGVYGQLYDDIGDTVGSEFRINQYVAGYQGYASLGVAADGSFVVAWTSSGQDEDGSAVMARRYSADGTPIDDEFVVNIYTVGSQYSPSISVTSSGDFVITWVSNIQDDGGPGIYAQRFDNSGSKIGVEFQVNTSSDEYLYDPSVSMASDGNFIVVWIVGLPHVADAYGQLFDSLGNRVGEEFVINTGLGPEYDYLDVSISSTVGIRVVWSDHCEGIVPGETYIRMYDNAGDPYGVEYPVNSYLEGGQTMPSQAMTSDGKLVVVWRSEYPIDDEWSIFAQRFDPSGNPIGVLPW